MAVVWLECLTYIVDTVSNSLVFYRMLQRQLPMVHRFFVPELPTASEFELPPNEAHHAGNVLRLRPGSEIEIFDGRGGVQRATIQAQRRQQVICSVACKPLCTARPPGQLTLAVALPKGDRQKVLIEKLTELGCDRLVPLVTQRGVAQPSSAALKRLESVVISACKQCGRNWLMEIADPQVAIDIEKWRCRSEETAIWFADTTDITARGPIMKAGTFQGIGLIGPEGGWTEDERRAAHEVGGIPFSLSRFTLRVETAAIALAAIVRWQMARSELDSSESISKLG